VASFITTKSFNKTEAVIFPCRLCLRTTLFSQIIIGAKLVSDCPTVQVQRPFKHDKFNSIEFEFFNQMSKEFSFYININENIIIYSY